MPSGRCLFPTLLAGIHPSTPCLYPTPAPHTPHPPCCRLPLPKRDQAAGGGDATRASSGVSTVLRDEQRPGRHYRRRHASSAAPGGRLPSPPATGVSTRYCRLHNTTLSFAPGACTAAPLPLHRPTRGHYARRRFWRRACGMPCGEDFCRRCSDTVLPVAATSRACVKHTALPRARRALRLVGQTWTGSPQPRTCRTTLSRTWITRRHSTAVARYHSTTF